jgi:multiple sugar transport system permease protein
MKKIATEAKLLLIGIPVAIWSLLPIYNLFLFSISTKEDAFAG